MKKNKRIGKMLELVMHSIFLVLGLITVGCVLLITVYLVISGIPADFCIFCFLCSEVISI